MPIIRRNRKWYDLTPAHSILCVCHYRNLYYFNLGIILYQMIRGEDGGPWWRWEHSVFSRIKPRVQHEKGVFINDCRPGKYRYPKLSSVSLVTNHLGPCTQQGRRARQKWATSIILLLGNKVIVWVTQKQSPGGWNRDGADAPLLVQRWDLRLRLRKGQTNFPRLSSFVGDWRN